MESRESALRIGIALILLLAAGLTLSSDLHRVAPTAGVCRFGFCRFEQMEPAASPGVALPLDSVNPYRWADRAEELDRLGRTEEARKAFGEAVGYGPNFPPILVRNINFCIIHDDVDAAIPLIARTLALAPDFDQLLFTDLMEFRRPPGRFLGSAIPEQPRPARAWVEWLASRGGEAEALEAWQWAQERKLLDGETAGRVAWALWNRRFFSATEQVWHAWLGGKPAGLLNHPRFDGEPLRSPREWTLDVHPAVVSERHDGLRIFFAGTENVSYSHVRQFVPVTAGAYVLVAEVSSEGLTTREGPLIHVFDVESPARLDVATERFSGTAEKHTVRLPIAVGAATRAIVVQVERRVCDKFDNKIAGSLHVHSLSLERSGRPE